MSTVKRIITSDCSLRAFCLSPPPPVVHVRNFPQQQAALPNNPNFSHNSLAALPAGKCCGVNFWISRPEQVLPVYLNILKSDQFLFPAGFRNFDILMNLVSLIFFRMLWQTSLPPPGYFLALCTTVPGLHYYA